MIRHSACLPVFIFFAWCFQVQGQSLNLKTVPLDTEFRQLRDAIKYASAGSSELRGVIIDLAKQTMMQQLALEQKTRDDGSSGIRLKRGYRIGVDNYESNSYVGGNNAFAIHDHSNNKYTIGMGEFSVVMNGVHFRTRHNDYKLVETSKTDPGYHVTQPLEFPPVPDDVLNQQSFEDELQEMREYFLAFKTQNVTHRDYRKYFKPVMCYLEGTWTLDKELEEPFDSDRHHLDARSWFDLIQRIRSELYTGIKNIDENLAFLPTGIMSVNEETNTPNYAQWNYRILCAPIQKDIPFKFFRQENDLKHRVRTGRSLEQVANTRAARYRLWDPDYPDKRQNILDEIFYSIPGKNNVASNLQQEGFGDDLIYKAGKKDNELLDTSLYHRFYRQARPDASGLQDSIRGFNDVFLFVAQTTQNRVAPMSFEKCDNKGDNCKKITNKFSYALPLEIIYLTPLLNWNPRKLKIHQGNTGSRENNRTGANSLAKAFDGVDNRNYNLLPSEFFNGAELHDQDAADTVPGSVHVLSKNGNEIYKMMASGTRIFLPSIPGVGPVRLRYPIAPIYDEYSSVWKELNALKDIVDYEVTPADYKIFKMSTSPPDPYTPHKHNLLISNEHLKRMASGKEVVDVVTSQVLGHTHHLKIKYDPSTETYLYIECDGRDLCIDLHPTEIIESAN